MHTLGRLPVVKSGLVKCAIWHVHTRTYIHMQKIHQHYNYIREKKKMADNLLSTNKSNCKSAPIHSKYFPMKACLIYLPHHDKKFCPTLESLLAANTCTMMK